jgi:hypothetical protein
MPVTPRRLVEPLGLARTTDIGRTIEHAPGSSQLSARDLRASYLEAAMDFNADDFADLSTVDAVHEFPFLTPGHAPKYSSRKEILDAYRSAWATPGLQLEEIRHVALRETDNPAVIVSE